MITHLRRGVCGVIQCTVFPTDPLTVVLKYMSCETAGVDVIHVTSMSVGSHTNFVATLRLGTGVLLTFSSLAFCTCHLCVLNSLPNL